MLVFPNHFRRRAFASFIRVEISNDLPRDPGSLSKKRTVHFGRASRRGYSVDQSVFERDQELAIFFLSFFNVIRLNGRNAIL
jgi:hypothetical protein